MNHPNPASTVNLGALARDRVVPDQSDAVPDVLRSFLDGAVSFPHDWWLAIQWSLGLKGVYGDRMQRNCDIIAKRLNVVLWMMRAGGPVATRAALATVHYMLSSEQTQCTALNVVLRRIDRTVLLHSGISTGASLSGRMTGGAFTLYASTGGRFGHQIRKSPAGVGIGISNLTLASAGAVIRLVMSSRDAELSAADVAMAVVAGINTRVTDATLWRDLIRAAHDCRLQENTADSSAFNELFRDVERFIANEQRQTG